MSRRNYRKPKNVSNGNSTHDRIVKTLEERLKNSSIPYQIFFKEHEYDDNYCKNDEYNVKKTVGHVHGEMDNGAIFRSKYKTYAVVIETKSTHGRDKANYQTFKDAHYLKKLYNVDRVFRMYAHGYHNSNDIRLEWLK